MSSYWKDAEAAFIAQAQDAALGPRKRKKNLPKGAASDSDEDQRKAPAPKPKKSKPKKPKSKSAVTASKLFTGSRKKPSDSQTAIAPPPNHAENIEKAAVPSDCENNATETQQSDIDGENVIGLFDGPDVEFDSNASSGPFDEDDDDSGGKATPEPCPDTMATPTTTMSPQDKYAAAAVSAMVNVTATLPNTNTNAAAAKSKKKPPTLLKPKKCAATEWSTEVMSHEDVMKGWIEVMDSGLKVICNICKGIPLTMKRPFDAGNLWMHCRGQSHSGAKQSTLNHERRIAEGTDK